MISLRTKYFRHMLDYCCSVEAKHRYVMLSGGVDSFMLLAAVNRCFRRDDITALIIKGVNTPDYRRAVQAAKYYGVGMEEVSVYMKDLMDNLHFCKGVKDVSVFQTMFRISTELLLQGKDLTDCAVYQGDGADSLYGNHNSYIYMTATNDAQSFGISKSEARERLKKKWRRHVMSGERAGGTAKLVGSIIKKKGGIPVQPWVSGEFEYVLDVPLGEFSGNKKRWVLDGLVKEWGVDRWIVDSRRRVTMQEGMGFYKLFCDELCKKFKVKSANSAVRKIAEA